MSSIFDKACRRVLHFGKKHSSDILSGLAILGLGVTTVLAVKETPKALDAIKLSEDEKGVELTKMEKVKVAYKYYIPATVSGISTATCILAANVLNKKKQASLMSAYTLLNSTYKEYRNKTNEIYGPDADEKIMSSIIADKLETVSVPSFKESFDDEVLFYDQYGDRFFYSTFKDVRDSEYKLNRNFSLGYYATLNDFYDFLGLKRTQKGDVLGWSLFIGETIYGYQWIDFNHRKVVEEDGTEYYVIEMPFEPTADFYDY